MSSSSYKFRRTNFSLGDHGTQYESTFNHDYTKKQGDRAEQVKRSGSHVTLGSEQIDYLTSYDKQHPHPENVMKQGSGVDMKKVSMTHFALGGDPVDYRSNATATIGATWAKCQQANHTTALPMKPFRSSIRVGKDPTPYFQSSYTAQTADLRQGGPIQLGKPKVNMYASNLSLGSDRNHYETSSKSNYYHKESNYSTTKSVAKGLSKDLKATHFSMGRQFEPISTISRESYTQQPLVYNPNAQSVENLRKSNISMGDTAISYQTETRNMLESRSLKNEKYSAGVVMNEDANKRQSHFGLGKHPGAYTTNYNDHFNSIRDLPRNPVASMQNLKKDLQCAHFELGDMDTQFTTESRSHFGSKPMDKVADYKSNGKSSFQLSNVNYTNWATQNQNDFVDRSKASTYKPVTNEDITKLQQSHFQVGIDPTHYESESKRALKYVKSAPNMDGINMGNKIRSTHWRTGEYGYKDNWTTTANDQMIWKQPVLKFNE